MRERVAGLCQLWSWSWVELAVKGNDLPGRGNVGISELKEVPKRRRGGEAKEPLFLVPIGITSGASTLNTDEARPFLDSAPWRRLDECGSYVDSWCAECSLQVPLAQCPGRSRDGDGRRRRRRAVETGGATQSWTRGCGCTCTGQRRDSVWSWGIMELTRSGDQSNVAAY